MPTWLDGELYPSAWTDLHRALDEDLGVTNSVENFLSRGIGHLIDETVTISAAAGTYVSNVFQVTGTVLVLDQKAIITRVGTLANMTGMYADIWDGTAATILTKDGAAISGMPVGSWFTKDKDVLSEYTVVDASTAKITIPPDGPHSAYPFYVTQKSGVDTFIRLHFSTTDDPVDVDFQLLFVWAPIDGGTLEIVS